MPDSSAQMEAENEYPLVIQGGRRRYLRNRRILSKSGRENVFVTEVSSKYYRYAKDFGNTLLNTRWRYVLLSLCVANAVAWVFFAILWTTVAVVNQDLLKNDTFACVAGTRSFAGYLLLSIETLTTIGFGEVYPRDCYENGVVLMLQALTGVAIEGALVTTVYVKMCKPNTKHIQQLFSKKAVVCLRDGKLCLIFRLHDEMGRFWAKTRAKAYYMCKRASDEGEQMDNYMQPLRLQKLGLILWPVDVVHVIDERSPFWDYSAKDLLHYRFEILVTIKGDSTVTGQPSQGQTSYTSRDILWGHRFKECVEFDDSKGKYVVHTSLFNATSPHTTPLCSASRYEEVREEAIGEIIERQSV